MNCESVNITMGRRVTDIHKEYINAGAKLIRTNTFAVILLILNAILMRLKLI
ncbi:MAG: homocysteine S-methyltransferase family protein [Lachnospira pectinoschiza]